MATTTNAPGELCALARVAGVPVERLQALRDDDAAGWADKVIALEHEIEQAAAAVSDSLHALIGDNHDQDQRRALINLRRKVFKGSAIDDPHDKTRLLAEIDPHAAATFERWLSINETLASVRRDGEHTVTADLADSRKTLRDSAADPALRRGLQIASPPLAARLPHYLSAEPVADKKQRKYERSILSYLARSAVKPSPFGSFTPVQTVRAVRGGSDPRALPLPAQSRSNNRINVAVLARISHCLLQNPTTRQDLPVEAIVGWRQVEDRIRYVRRWMAQGDEDQAVTFDSVTDKVFFLRATHTIDDLLSTLEEGGRTFGELTDRIGELYDASPQLAAAYLGMLIDIGLVDVPVLQTPVHAEDPVREMAASLSRVDADWARRLVSQLEAVDAVLQQVGEESTRVDALAELPDRLEQIFVDLDAPAHLPQTLLYEDDVLGDQPLTVDAEIWARTMIEPLGVLDALVPAFDITLPQRLTLTAFFVARFGAGGECDDVLRLLHEFQEDFFEQYQSISGQRSAYVDGVYQPEVNWLGSEAIHAIDDARREFDQAVTRLYNGHERADELVLGSDVLEAVGKHTALVCAQAEPRSYLVQQASIDGAPCTVLNQLYGGLHFPFSRFAYALTDHGGAPMDATLRARSADAVDDDQVYAEVTGGIVTSNLNLHPELTTYEIVCPGERSTRPADEQIDFDDLFAVHDVARDRVVLRSRRLGKEVVPAYLGYLIPLALPQIPRSLLLFAPTAMMQLDPWAGQAEAPVSDGVGYRPRVRVGEVVVSRRSWRAAAADLPFDSADDAGRMLAWRRWRTHHGLPERVFAKVERSSGFRGAGTSKPMYVDFAAGLTIQALEGAVDGDALVTFTEALPDPTDAPGIGEFGSHAIEYAVETIPGNGSLR